MKNILLSYHLKQDSNPLKGRYVKIPPIDLTNLEAEFNLIIHV